MVNRYENMLTIINHQANINENHNEINQDWFSPPIHILCWRFHDLISVHTKFYSFLVFSFFSVISNKPTVWDWAYLISPGNIFLWLLKSEIYVINLIKDPCSCFSWYLKKFSVSPLQYSGSLCYPGLFFEHVANLMLSQTSEGSMTLVPMHFLCYGRTDS